MRPIPLLITNVDGAVEHDNPHATALLGTGSTCAALVRAEDGRGRRVCTENCARDMRPGEQRDHGIVKIRRRSFRLVCSAIGEGRIITMVPMAAGADAPPLSPREREVLQLVARGLTGQRIARRLGITPATVSTHVQHVRDKLGVRTRSQAVARALALGQIE